MPRKKTWCSRTTSLTHTDRWKLTSFSKNGSPSVKNNERIRTHFQSNSHLPLLHFFPPQQVFRTVMTPLRWRTGLSKPVQHYPSILIALCCLLISLESVPALSLNNARAFKAPKVKGDGLALEDPPKLILVGGCSGTGKSTFGMSLALDQGILKCVSTDTLRSVMRSFIDKDISPALHRSSYAPSDPEEAANESWTDDPVKSWKETCLVVKHSVDELVDEMMGRGVSIVLEGVHLIPSTELLKKWEASGGVATGIVLQVSDEQAHKSLFVKRGISTGKGEEAKLRQFQRIRAIHDEMVRLGKEADWLIIEQDLRPDPLDIVAESLASNCLVNPLNSVPIPQFSLQKSSQNEKAIKKNGETKVANTVSPNANR